MSRGVVFQSTLPVRGATRLYAESMCWLPISIHAPRAGSDDRVQSVRRVWCISIHAPRAGSDAIIVPPIFTIFDFNPRSPCGERHSSTITPPQSTGFQSTLPVRGATLPLCILPRGSGHFNPRSPCGERLISWVSDMGAKDFNPRSPCGERRFPRSRSITAPGFQSTLPVRGATSAFYPITPTGVISIHAPRAGSDKERQRDHQ